MHARLGVTHPVAGQALNRADDGAVENVGDDAAVFPLPLALRGSKHGH